MTVGERIKKRRIELGISAEELAKKLGKSRATIYRYESNFIYNMPASTLIPLAKLLQCSPDYLMGWEELDHNKIYIAEEIHSSRLQTYKIQIYNDTDRNIFATDLPEDKYLLIGNGNVKELTPAEHTVLNNVLTAMDSEDK